MMDVINSIAWVGANILIAYVAVAVVVFVIGYYVLFDPSATTAGKMVFRFMLSLVGVVILTFIGTYVNPSADRHWLVYPRDVMEWRPVVRVVVYGYVAYTITSLAVLLAIRKWRPEKVKKASDLMLVQPRHPTNGVPIISTTSPEGED